MLWTRSSDIEMKLYVADITLELCGKNLLQLRYMDNIIVIHEISIDEI